MKAAMIMFAKGSGRMSDRQNDDPVGQKFPHLAKSVYFWSSDARFSR
jgi:hypothetical protein